MMMAASLIARQRATAADADTAHEFVSHAAQPLRHKTSPWLQRARRKSNDLGGERVPGKILEKSGCGPERV